METFYEWLKTQPNVLREYNVPSQMIIGSIDIPLVIVDEPKVVTAQESARLMQMENYVKQFSDVDDALFNTMLQDRHVRSYQKLAAEYLPVDGGIASDLRNDGWMAVARYIAYVRNRKKITAKDLPQPSKLKTCLINAQKQIQNVFSREK